MLLGRFRDLRYALDGLPQQAGRARVAIDRLPPKIASKIVRDPRVPRSAVIYLQGRGIAGPDRAGPVLTKYIARYIPTFTERVLAHRISPVNA
jgi:hypothetical protein